MQNINKSIKDTITVSNTKALTVAGTGAKTVNVFLVNGAVKILNIYGSVTSVLGSNMTACSFDFYAASDAAVPITSAAGTTLSDLAAGSVIAKTTAAATAITSLSNAAVIGPDETITAKNQVLVAKAATASYIRFAFSSTNNPSVGSVKFYVEYIPLTATSYITAV